MSKKESKFVTAAKAEIPKMTSQEAQNHAVESLLKNLRQGVEEIIHTPDAVRQQNARDQIDSLQAELISAQQELNNTQNQVDSRQAFQEREIFDPNRKKNLRDKIGNFFSRGKNAEREQNIYQEYNDERDEHNNESQRLINERSNAESRLQAIQNQMRSLQAEASAASTATLESRTVGKSKFDEVKEKITSDVKAEFAGQGVSELIEKQEIARRLAARPEIRLEKVKADYDKAVAKINLESQTENNNHVKVISDLQIELKAAQLSFNDSDIQRLKKEIFEEKGRNSLMLNDQRDRKNQLKSTFDQQGFSLAMEANGDVGITPEEYAKKTRKDAVAKRAVELKASKKA